MKIAVLLGGTSAERDVSIASGLQIAEALNQRGHNIIAIDAAGDLKQIDFSKGYSVGVIPPNERALNDLDECSLAERLRSNELSDIDVVFIGLHGGTGEDGTIQALLNLCGATYTGSDVLASAAAMDKAFSKMVFKAQGIPTPEWRLYNRSDNPDMKAIIYNIENNPGLPVVIKPNAQGSTVGLTIVRTVNEIGPAVKHAFEYDNRVLIEEYIAGRELTVSIVGDYDLPVIEIIPEGGLYNYECKYTPGKSQYVYPAEIPPDVAEKCREYGRRAFDLLGCRDYGRIDFRMDEDNNLYCLEVNTLPGMTPTSLVPKSMKAIGIGFGELVEIIAKLALEHKNEK